MKQPTRGLLVALGLAVAALTAVALYHLAPALTEAISSAGDMPASALLSCLALLLCSYLMRSARLYDGHRQSGLASLPDAWHITVIHAGLTTLLPMRSGEASLPILLNQRWQVPSEAAVHTLLWLRLQDLVVIGLLVAALLIPLSIDGPLLATLWLAGAVTAAFAIRAAAGRFRNASDGHHPAQRGFAQRAARWLLRAVYAGASSPLRLWIWTVLSWSSKLTAIAWLMQACLPALGEEPRYALWAALGGEMGSALPGQLPAQVGTYEAGVWAGVKFSGADIDAPPVLAAAIVIHAVMLLTAWSACLLSLLITSVQAWMKPRGST